MSLVERVQRDPEKLNGILVDITRCIGCRACMAACKDWNNLPHVPQIQPHAPRGDAERGWNEPRLTAYDYIVMNAHQAEGKDGKRRWHHVRRACYHCKEPICFEACFVHSYRKTQEGPVVYAHPEICVGCRYCQLACPFLSVQVEWDQVFSRISKCTGCHDRVVNGLVPACVDACPTKSLEYGNRDELLAEAKARIAASPDRYVDHVFGEKEVGGTTVMYISGAPFEELGFNADVIKKPITEYTWKYMKKAPILAVSLPLFFAALYATTKQKAEHNEDL